MVWVSKKELEQKIGLSPTTLKRLRISGKWVLGIHYQEIGSRPCWRAGDGRAAAKILYHLENCQHWVQTRHDPHLHEKFCFEYQENLSN